MRPPHHAGEMRAGDRPAPLRHPRFNEAPASRGEMRGLGCLEGLLALASMRPPHHAGEMAPRSKAQDTAPRASMRPPHHAGEMAAQGCSRTAASTWLQ